MNLKELRIKNGYTQKNVADHLNCSPTVYSRYETGDRQPSIEVLISLAEFFGVTVDHLIGKEELPRPELLPYEQSLLSAAKNADERAQKDALAILLLHQD